MFVRPRAVQPRKRKKGKYRLFATSALVISSALAAKPAASPQQQPAVVRTADLVSFSIPAGRLDAVLSAFAIATRTTLDIRIPADTVSMMQSPGVSGSLPIDAALRRALDGTSLAFRRNLIPSPAKRPKLARKKMVSRNSKFTEDLRFPSAWRTGTRKPSISTS